MDTWKKNNRYYSEIRKRKKLTQLQASSMMDTISEDRLARIEAGKIKVTPEDILEMEEAYQKPDLCNYYCTHECAIGKKTMPVLQSQQLSTIILKILSSLNSVEQEKNKLIEITADGIISRDELAAFVKIQKELDNISFTVDSLKLWIQETIANGEIDKEEYEKLLQKK